MERTRTYQTHQVIKCNAGKNALERKAFHANLQCSQDRFDLGADLGYQGLAQQSLVTRIVPKPVGVW